MSMSPIRVNVKCYLSVCLYLVPLSAWVRKRVERRVDQAASKLLISPAEYRLAETMYGPCVPKLAVELGVTQGLVRAYQGTLAV